MESRGHFMHHTCPPLPPAVDTQSNRKMGIYVFLALEGLGQKVVFLCVQLCVWSEKEKTWDRRQRGIRAAQGMSWKRGQEGHAEFPSPASTLPQHASLLYRRGRTGGDKEPKRGRRKRGNVTQERRGTVDGVCLCCCAPSQVVTYWPAVIPPWHLIQMHKVPFVTLSLLFSLSGQYLKGSQPARLLLKRLNKVTLNTCAWATSCSLFTSGPTTRVAPDYLQSAFVFIDTDCEFVNLLTQKTIIYLAKCFWENVNDVKHQIWHSGMISLMRS